MAVAMVELEPARVAAVQWERRPFASVDALAAAVRVPLGEAVAAGARLVVFAPGVAEALAGVAAGGGSAPRQPAGDAALDASALARFESLGRELAAASGVTLALGPASVRSAEGIRRITCLFGPHGELLGARAQTHRSPAERAQGLVRGDTLEPVETPLGLVGLVCGTDVEYPEVSRILCLQGAAVLVHQGVLERFREADALSRLWREVQGNQVFGVEAYAVGQGARGRSAIHAPVEVTPDGSGWLARAPDGERPAVVVAELDPAALRGLLGSYNIAGLRNLGECERYFPMLYDGAAGGQA